MKFSVILVNPEESLNIGSVARAMRNLSFDDLRLVAPQDFRIERAAITACHAADLLSSAVVFSTLSDAIADLHHVVGFSARDGDNRPVPLTLHDWVARLKEQDASIHGGDRVGLVFGPESTGLHTSDVAACQRLVVIPSNPIYSSFNLSHAVLLALYELTRSGVREMQGASLRGSDPAERSQVLQLERLVDEVATLSQFYRRGTPPIMRELLPQLLTRMEPQKRELAILLGLFSRIKKTIERMPLMEEETFLTSDNRE